MGATPDYSQGTGTAAMEAAQANHIQHTKDTVAAPAMTQPTGHTTDLAPTTAHQVTLRTTVDHIHAHPTDLQNITHTKKDHIV